MGWVDSRLWKSLFKVGGLWNTLPLFCSFTAPDPTLMCASHPAPTAVPVSLVWSALWGLHPRSPLLPRLLGHREQGLSLPSVSVLPVLCPVVAQMSLPDAPVFVC